MSDYSQLSDDELLAAYKAAKPPVKTSTPEDFAKAYGPAAERAGKALGVDPKTLLGQWGLETGWGKSIVPGTNNLGNIKDFAGGGVEARDNMTGSRDKYRAYASPEEFADDYSSLIQRKYPDAMGAKDPMAFAQALKAGGYAEDPRYVDKVAQAARMAGNRTNPVVAAVGKAVNAVIPSAEAAQPVEFSKMSDADLLAAYKAAKAQSAPAPAQQKSYNPTDDMSTTERVLAGVGSGMTDLAYGVGQRLGMVEQSTIDEKKRLDAALKNTTSGSVGNIAGQVAVGLPAAFIPGANTLGGAALIGAAQGMAQPTATGESVLSNAALGAAGGAGGVAVGRGLQAGYQGAKALAAPFTQKGQQKIAADVLERFAQNPQAIQQAPSGATAIGTRPTLAQATRDPGLAQLERALQSQDPQIANALATRGMENNAARVQVLQDIAGDPAKRAAAVKTLKDTTSPMYAKALGQTVEVNPELADLLNRPSVQKAIGRAAGIAKEEGRTFGLNPATPAKPGPQIVDASGKVLSDLGTPAEAAKVTGQTLQDIKMGLDALLQDPTSGIAGKEAANVKATRDAIVAAMEDAIPDFKNARTTYASLKKPINAMDAGQALLEKGTSNLKDLEGNPRMAANALAGILKSEGKQRSLVRGATDFKGVNSLADVLSPDQLGRVNSVVDELHNVAAVANAAGGTNSQTAQRLAAQNILRQLIGPTGLPQSWAESTLLNTAMRPVQFAYSGVAEPKIQNALAQMLLDPDVAKAALAANTPKQQNALMKQLAPYLQQAAQQSTPAALVSK